MVSPLIVTSSTKSSAFPRSLSAAKDLKAAQRRQLSVQALAGHESITDLARDRNVSRKFVHAQAAKAAEALEEAFDPSAPDEKVLFHLPVTQDWIRQFVLAQVLIGHTSFRGVIEILNAVFDWRRISVGTVHNIVGEAVDRAHRLGQGQELSSVAVGAHDEIYQAGRPVLVGVDVESTYCYLLAAEEHCDETSWGVHLLDLADRGLHPRYTIADGGSALRSGQAAAWGDVPCHGDVFHAERDMSRLAFYLKNRAAGCTKTRQKLERKMRRWTKHHKGNRFSKKVAVARRAQREAVDLARDVRILANWMQRDILSAAGPDLATRGELYDFVVEELRQREAMCPHRIGRVRGMLERHRPNLLAFVSVLDERLDEIATRLGVGLRWVHAVCELLGRNHNQPAYWQRENQLRHKLPDQFHLIQAAVADVLAHTPRASSVVENTNSRLRNYFFLRRHVGNGYLTLLQFFLNHRRFVRSQRPERVGKSPAELLTGEAHRHWLELLGYERFHRN